MCFTRVYQKINKTFFKIHKVGNNGLYRDGKEKILQKDNLYWGLNQEPLVFNSDKFMT